MKVSVVGLGYIGLPSSVVVANAGHAVLGVDTNSKIVEQINAGKAHITEPLLAELVQNAVSEGSLRASTEAEPADIFMIAVPTPFNSVGDEKLADLTYLYSAIDGISTQLRPGNLIIIESTVPIGTTDLVCDYLSKLRDDLTISGSEKHRPSDIHLAFCPERVLPGNIIHELKHNNRIIGGSSAMAATLAKDFYSTFVTGSVDVVSQPKIAEAAKLVENTYRDVNIAFANQLSMFADQLDLNVWEIINVANKHPRVNILNPGCGVGGHCIAVDPWFLISANKEHTSLFSHAREINLKKTEYVICRIFEIAKSEMVKDIICLGLTYKSDSDDLRESPSLYIYQNLKRKLGKRVKAFDPNLSKEDNKTLGSLDNIDDIDPSRTIFILLVDHSAFTNILPECSQVLNFTSEQ